LVAGQGIAGDAHAGPGRRQISLLALEDIREMQGKGLIVQPGDFAENITTEGIPWNRVSLGDQISIGEAVLEVTQIGKVCHTPCQIYRTIGDCVMPRRGIFAKVLTGGTVSHENIGTYHF
jgi:MOSC domain-containing protein YiiM